MKKGVDANLLGCARDLEPDFSVPDFRFWSPIYIAIHFGPTEVCRFLVETGVHSEKDDLALAQSGGN